MLNILAILFPSVRNLIEINETRKQLIENISIKKDYVLIEPIDVNSDHFINSIGGLWQDSDSLKWFMVSIRQTIFNKMLKEENAEAYKNQIIGIESVIKAFEEYQKKYEQIQVLQTKGNERTS